MAVSANAGATEIDLSGLDLLLAEMDLSDSLPTTGRGRKPDELAEEYQEMLQASYDAGGTWRVAGVWPDDEANNEIGKLRTRMLRWVISNIGTWDADKKRPKAAVKFNKMTPAVQEYFTAKAKEAGQAIEFPPVPAGSSIHLVKCYPVSESVNAR